MIGIDLKGQRALVCGSTRGIGRAIAFQLATAGAGVTLFSRNEDALKKVQESLPGKDHRAMVADFSNPAKLEELSADLISGHFDILVNNTGGPPPGLVNQAEWQDFEHAITMHLRANHMLMQYVVPHMKAQRYGRIINIISTSVRIPLVGLGVSNTVRGAVASWSKTLANELGAFNITVNNLLPGFIETQRLNQIISNKSSTKGISKEEVMKEMRQEVPMRRFGQPEEMGSIAAFLASPLAGYINGTSIPIDGGRTGSI